MYYGWITSNWEVPGYKRGIGQPRTNWRGVIKKDLEKMGLTWEETQLAALYRQEWRQSVGQCVHLNARCIKVKVKVKDKVKNSDSGISK